MLFELFPFVVLLVYNAMFFVYAYFFSDFLRFYLSFIIDCYTARVSNKHFLLSLFLFLFIKLNLLALCCVICEPFLNPGHTNMDIGVLILNV